MYAIMRTEKHHTMGEIAAMGKHNERTRDTPNADPERLAANVRLVGSGNWVADAQARLDEATNPRFRPDAIRGVEVFMGVSPAFKDTATEADWRVWVERSMGWLTDTFRDPRNVVAAVWHRDELTPHIQALVVPLREDNGRLSYEHYLGGSKYRLSEVQTSYAEAVRDLGLERGVQGSQATHQDVQRWYAKITEPTPAPEIVRREVEVERPGRIVGNPERWASEQSERIAERITPPLDAALVKATHYEEQAAKAEANVVVLQQRVREVERERDTLQRDYTTLVAQVRQLEVRGTMQTLGGEQDRHDKHKWQVNGEHISITGEKFYNHDRQQGGGGSIDLVMHVTGYTFRQAVAYLSHEAGPALAVAAAANHGARERTAQAEEIVERGERAPFNAPARHEDRWPGVRAYLVEQRGLPGSMVDALHERGALYADRRSNAVFLRTDAEGQAVGASLRGTLPGSEFQGLAAGCRREAGHFSYSLNVGRPEPYDTPQYYVTESPIDALSRAALIQRSGEHGAFTFVSTDGHGDLPRRQIDEGVARRALVHCGFDNDKGGATLWAQVKEAYPRAEAIVRERPPTGAKDWNDALRTEQARTQAQEQTRTAAGDRAPAKDTDYHDR